MSSQTLLRLLCSTKQDVTPIQEVHRARFYEDYRKVSEDYDNRFLKKHGEDLNMTLIFVSFHRFIVGSH